MGKKGILIWYTWSWHTWRLFWIFIIECPIKSPILALLLVSVLGKVKKNHLRQKE